MKRSPETVVNPEETARELPPQQKLTPDKAAAKFNTTPQSIEGVQGRVKELTASLDELFDSYERLRGKTDDASLAAKKFIVSQSEILIKELEKIGVNTSGIVTDEMLQPHAGKVATAAMSLEPATPSEPPATQNFAPIPQKNKGFFSIVRGFFIRKEEEKATPAQVIPEQVTSESVTPLNEESVASTENWLPYKTPINTKLFNNTLFKKVMLGLPTQREDLPISGEQASTWTLPAIQEINRLQKDNATNPQEKMHAIAQLQQYLAQLQSDPVNSQHVIRTRDNFLNQK